MERMSCMLDKDFIYYLFAAFVIAVLIYYTKRIFIQNKTQHIDQTLLGIAIGFVATIFSFLLGFVIVNLWEGYSEAERNTFIEATELRTIYRVAEGLTHGEKLQNIVKDYTQSVVKDEWIKMQAGDISPQADHYKNLLWKTALKLAKEHNGDEVLTSKILDAVIKFNDARRERIASLDSSLHPLLLYSLIATASFTIICFCFVETKKSRLHFLFDLFLVFCVVFNFYLIHSIDSPFSGKGISVTPAAFTHLSEQLQ